jgi:two-component system response regulator YesN
MIKKLLGAGKNGRNFLLSYLFIMIIPLAIIAISYFVSLKAVRVEAQNVQAGAQRHLKSIIDNVFYEVIEVATGIELDDYIINTVISIEPEMDPQQRFDIYKSVKLISAEKLNSSYIEHIIICFENNDTFITQKGSMSPEDFFDNYSTLGFENVQELLGFMRGDYEINEMKMMEVEGSPMIFIMSPLPIFGKNSNMANMVIVLDMEAIGSLVDELKYGDKGKFYIYDVEGNMVFGSDNDEEIDLELNKSKNEDYYYDTINGEIYSVGVIKSDYKDLYYVSTVPQSVFMSNQRMINFVFMVGTAVCLLAGLMLSFYFTKRNYGPIRKITDFLSKNFDAMKITNENDVKFIEKSLIYLIEDRKDNQEKSSRQKEEARIAFLRKMLNGTCSYRTFYQRMHAYDIEFESSLFTVISIEIEDGWGEGSYETVLVMLSKFTKDTFSESFVVYTIPNDKGMVIILNHREKGEDAVPDTEIILLGYNLKNAMTENSIIISLAISKTHQGADDLSVCYKEAQKTMEYKMILGRGELIHYDEIADNQINIFKSYYTLDNELKLSNALKASDIYAALDIIDEVFEGISMQKEMSVELVRCAVFSIVNTMVSTLGSMGDIYAKFVQELSPMKTILTKNTIEEIHFNMIEIIKKINEYVERNENKKSKIEHIKKFIESNYMDYELNATKVAIMHSMSSAYLSKMFKAHTGENISNYIGKIRIEKSKEMLMKDKNYNIHDLAEKCGFLNVNTFIRTFKKCEDVTPGHYRSNICNIES